jgi:uncharacterized protein
MQLRDATASDFAQILRLNTESEHFLSPLTLSRLEALHSQATYHRIVESEAAVCAFLLALPEGRAYDSPNYLWFAKRFERFLYIDRVVVSAQHQGRGLGKLLYTDLFSFASRVAATHVTCEFDIEPPNEASQRFHQSFGFREVGTQRVASGKKLVSLQAVALVPTAVAA